MANRRCSFIKPGGERCRGTAARGADLCYAHDPARAAERSRNASRGGKAGGNGRTSGLTETAEAKRWIKALVSRLLKGEVERDVATAAFQGINVLARYIELENKLKLTEEIEERREALEEQEQPNGHVPKGGRAWGR